MKKLPEKISRKALLELPVRDWDSESDYDALLIVPTGRKHDSGWSLIAMIASASCDDICWTMPVNHPYGKIEPGKNRMILRTDCYYPSGIVRMWASGEHYFKGMFRVGRALSSTDVELIVVQRGDGVNRMTGEVISSPEPAS